MPVTELAILRLPSSETPSESLLQGLKKAKEAMEAYSGYPFFYYHCLEDPTVVYIFGAWPSVKFHMEQWIPSQENQDLLKLLEGQLSVDAMFHVEVDQTLTPLPTSSNIVAVARHYVTDGRRDEFEQEFSQARTYLDAVVGGENVVGGWRLDRDGNKDEFVLLSGWESTEKHSEFGRSPDFTKYARIREFIDGADVKHAKLLDVSGNGQS